MRKKSWDSGRRARFRTGTGSQEERDWRSGGRVGGQEVVWRSGGGLEVRRKDWRLGGRAEGEMGPATHSGWAAALVAVGEELVQHHAEAPHVRLAGEDVVR